MSPLLLALARHGSFARSTVIRLLRRLPPVAAFASRGRRAAHPGPMRVPERVGGIASGPPPATPAATDNACSWMTSSMDLVQGVEVFEADRPAVDEASGWRLEPGRG